MKKILIVSSYAPPAISGSPQLMRKMLQYLPKDSYVLLTSYMGIDPHTKGDTSWLPARYYFYDSPTFVGDKGTRSESFWARLRGIAKQNVFARFLAEVFLLFVVPVRAVWKGLQVIRTERPDVLLAYSDSGLAFITTYVLHLLTGIPYCIYFYDLYADTKLPPVHAWVARRIERRVVMQAQRVFAMCVPTADVYSRKYGRECVIIDNYTTIPPQQPVFRPFNQPARIIYTGTIYWAQESAVRNLVAAVEGMKDEGVELWLYTPHTAAYLEGYGIRSSDSVRLASGSMHEMQMLQAQADILAIALSFGTAHEMLIHTASPTKTFEYMVSGRPMLVHAPAGSYVAQYARERGFAYVVDTPSVAVLQEGIRAILSNTELARELTQRAWETAILFHNDKKAAEQFKTFFNAEK